MIKKKYREFFQYYFKKIKFYILSVSKIIKDNFHIITGGPGSGKTTLLEKLKSMGYEYVPETARRIIQERKSKNLSPRPEHGEFGRLMYKKDFDNYLDNFINKNILFFDRSFVESLHYVFIHDFAYYEEVKDVLFQYRFNRNVFILPPWKKIYTTDSERDQTFGESVKVYENIYSWYEKSDYNLIIVPEGDSESRSEFVLSLI